MQGSSPQRAAPAGGDSPPPASLKRQREETPRALETPEERRLRRCRHNEIEQRRRNRMRELFDRLDTLSLVGAGTAVLAQGQPAPKRQRNKNGVRKEKEAILVQAIAKLTANEHEIKELRRELAAARGMAVGVSPAGVVAGLAASAASVTAAVTAPATLPAMGLSPAAAAVAGGTPPLAAAMAVGSMAAFGGAAPPVAAASLPAAAAGSAAAAIPARLTLTPQGHLSHANAEALVLFGVASPAALSMAFLGNLTAAGQAAYVGLVMRANKAPGSAVPAELELLRPVSHPPTRTVRMLATMDSAGALSAGVPAIQAVVLPLAAGAGALASAAAAAGTGASAASPAVASLAKAPAPAPATAGLSPVRGSSASAASGATAAAASTASGAAAAPPSPEGATASA